MPRFFVEPSDIQDGIVTLTGENAHHAAYSLRLAPGDRITVCDQHLTYVCELARFDETTASAQILSSTAIDTEPPFTAHLFQALPKGDKLDMIIQKAVECGVSEIIPFESSFCVVRVKPEAEERKTERRQRIAEAAAKQCGRGIIPPVRKTVSFADALDEAGRCDLVLFCYEGDLTTSLKTILDETAPALSKIAAAGRTPDVAIMIGSEGGFSAEEARTAKERGFAMTHLGKRILRTETASGFVLSCLSYRFEL